MPIQRTNRRATTVRLNNDNQVGHNYDATFELIVTEYVARYAFPRGESFAWDVLRAEDTSEFIIKVDSAPGGVIYIDLEKVLKALSNNIVAAILADGDSYDYHDQKVQVVGTLKGGKQNVRDQDYGLLKGPFKDWYHLRKQKSGSRADVSSREEMQLLLYEYEQEQEKFRRGSSFYSLIERLGSPLSAYYYAAFRLISGVLYQEVIAKAELQSKSS